MKKLEEIQSYSIEELEQRIAAEQENLTRLKFAHAISPIENPMKIRENRRLIARLMTQLSVKQSETK